ncbi:Calpain-7 [Amphibalanus amphitrite]|uniref:Calpain-7 n=1 Tax=Amphibalanus amphitrite TaxID=1232801 RepID=A0A6A4X096_AMPAM|nr:Calpain-7 [Amphibalanus amphitrite]
MSSPAGDEGRQLFERAAELASRAVAFDRSGHQEAAVYHYVQAAGALLEARKTGATIAHLEKRANDYLSRAEQLSEKAAKAVPLHAPAADGRAEMERVFFLMSQALDEDEAGNAREALQLYGQAVELCLEANKKFPSPRFTEAAEQALGRAERLKASLGASLESLPPPLPELDDLPELELEEPSAPPAETPPPPAGRASGGGGTARPPARSPRNDKAPLHRGFSSGLLVSGSDAYTKDELRVLAATSRINDNVYVPFMAADLRERFASPLPFTDRAGPLALSPKQRRDFSRWARPEELSDQPCMIQKIDCFSIKQTCISDCSFVASLAVSALYEKRFNKPLITSIIYPRNRNNQPVYNPCGKYMVRLHINGVPRKVVIDDQLPVDRHGRLLCSYSADRRELWVSLLEKAYMKVMGGYDFPGSNSNIDLYALTGWIPERQSIRPGDAEFNADALFRRLHDCHQKGQVLITVATGEMSEQAADRAGLVPTHAYAVLDIREVQGQRLLLLKNPWSHLRWKGNFSEMDQRHWTPSLRAALSYDPQSAQQFDNGVFWIDYESLCRFFDVFYMSWNPQLFSHTFCHHQTWLAGQGPIRDMYNIGENPQYRLEVRGPTVVWVLLSRHITEIEDFRNNKEYITVAVYRTDGSRVYYPSKRGGRGPRAGPTAPVSTTPVRGEGGVPGLDRRLPCLLPQ